MKPPVFEPPVNNLLLHIYVMLPVHPQHYNTSLLISDSLKSTQPDAQTAAQRQCSRMLICATTCSVKGTRRSRRRIKSACVSDSFTLFAIAPLGSWPHSPRGVSSVSMFVFLKALLALMMSSLIAPKHTSWSQRNAEGYISRHKQDYFTASRLFTCKQ